MTFLNLKTSLAALALATSFATYALPADQRQPINIEADSAVFDQPKGQASYTGNVIVKQGSITIKAEELSIFTDPNTGDFKALHAAGEPSQFSQQINEAGSMMRATGNRLEYDVALGELEIHDNGYLQRGDDEISADYIHYMLNDSTFKAENRGNGRVNMTLQPTIIESAE